MGVSTWEGGSLEAVCRWGSRRTQTSLCQTLGRAGRGRTYRVERSRMGAWLPAAGGIQGTVLRCGWTKFSEQSSETPPRGDAEAALKTTRRCPIFQALDQISLQPPLLPAAPASSTPQHRLGLVPLGSASVCPPGSADPVFPFADWSIWGVTPSIPALSRSRARDLVRCLEPRVT